jgi:hypothetical protein
MPFFLGTLSVVAQSRVSVPVKLKIEDGGMEEVTVVLRNNTSGETNEIPGSQRMDLSLKINNSYLISFTKTGYITKRISFDARMPSSRSDQDLYPFNFEVVLFPQYEGLNIVVFNQPVAKIFFDPLLDDFDYDTDYTKQIQSALKKAEEELVQRQKEERKKVAEEKKKEDQQLAEENRKKKEEERLKMDEEKRLKNEEEKMKREEARQQKVAEDQRKTEARALQGVDQRRQSSQSGSDARASTVYGTAGEDNNGKAGGTGGIDAANQSAVGIAGETGKTNMNGFSGADAQDNGSASYSGADVKSSEKSVLMQGKDNVESKVATVGTGDDDRPDPMKTAETKTFQKGEQLKSTTTQTSINNLGMKVDEYQENGKRIIKVSYIDPSLKQVFMKVIYDWGGVYYFKSGYYISQAYFQSVTGIK